MPGPVSDGQAVAAARVPKARSPTPQEISQWMLEDFEQLPDYQMLCGGGDKPGAVGDVVLWRGFKGNNPASTKVEHFRGVVNDIDRTDEGVFLYASYVEQTPPVGWLVANGGRCYRATEVESNFKNMVLCPECAIWKKDLWAYEGCGLRCAVHLALQQKHKIHESYVEQDTSVGGLWRTVLQGNRRG